MKCTNVILLIAICILPTLSIASSAYASNTIIYLEDGEEQFGETDYKVDYLTVQNSPNTPSQRLEATSNSEVSVSDTEVYMDYTYKVPSEENPNSYDLQKGEGMFDIINVEELGDNLRKYKLSSIQYNEIYPIPPTLTETSPNTAVVNVTVDISSLLNKK